MTRRLCTCDDFSLANGDGVFKVNTTVCFQWVERLLHSNPTSLLGDPNSLGWPQQATTMQAASASPQVSFTLCVAIRMVRSGPQSGLHFRNTVVYNCHISVGSQQGNMTLLWAR